MTFNGYSSVNEYIRECARLGWSVRVMEFERAIDKPLEPVPYRFAPLMQNKASDIREDTPGRLTVVLAFAPSPSALACWDMFDEALERHYANGTGQDYLQLLHNWGYEPAAPRFHFVNRPGPSQLR